MLREVLLIKTLKKFRSFASAKSQHVRSIVNVENAKIALDDTLVKSPLDATIISRPVEVGQVISTLHPQLEEENLNENGRPFKSKD